MSQEGKKSSESDYKPETCAWCKSEPMLLASPACGGNGTVLVKQPPVKCFRCKGKGKALNEHDRPFYPRCSICQGVGWLQVLRKS
jgi:DnaJ-class molecular chaperone